jgi:hypothetical protein
LPQARASQEWGPPTLRAQRADHPCRPLEPLDKWDDHTAAKEAMLRRTDTEWAPRTTIKSNDKKRANPV